MMTSKMTEGGWLDESVRVKALAMPAQRTKLHAQNPPKGGKRTTPQSCLLISSHVGAVSQTPIHTHITHTHK